MTCKHRYLIEKIEDIPNDDFHLTKNGDLSKRWKTSMCKLCGHIKTEPVF